MAAREVVVSSLATVYALSATNDDAAAQALSPIISQGWSLATALSLLVWFIYAPQCLSTLATIRRETSSWKQTGVRHRVPVRAGLPGVAAHLPGRSRAGRGVIRDWT